MKILTNLEGGDDECLESYRPKDSNQRWEMVTAGFWSQTQFNSGYISYYLTRDSKGTWIMESVERDAELDGVTEEDVKAGRLNDDQIQALSGRSLEEAQNEEYRRIAAVMEDAPAETTPATAARLMYKEIEKRGGKIVDEMEDEEGLLYM